MPQTKPDHESENPLQENYYEIHVKGNLIPLWEEWFEGLTATILENDEIILSGPVTDQSELHGLIVKLRNLNMELISIKKVNKVPK